VLKSKACLTPIPKFLACPSDPLSNTLSLYRVHHSINTTPAKAAPTPISDAATPTHPPTAPFSTPFAVAIAESDIIVPVEIATGGVSDIVAGEVVRDPMAFHAPPAVARVNGRRKRKSGSRRWRAIELKVDAED